MGTRPEDDGYTGIGRFRILSLFTSDVITAGSFGNELSVGILTLEMFHNGILLNFPLSNSNLGTVYQSSDGAAYTVGGLCVCINVLCACVFSVQK